MDKEKTNELTKKLDIIIYLLILNLKQKDNLEEKVLKHLVKLFMDSGYKWRDVADILNISTATINKIIK